MQHFAPTHTYVRNRITIGRQGHRFAAWHHTGWQTLSAQTIAEAWTEVEAMYQ